MRSKAIRHMAWAQATLCCVVVCLLDDGLEGDPDSVRNKTILEMQVAGYSDFEVGETSL